MAETPKTITQSSSPRFFIITRHQRTIRLLTKYGGKIINDISQVPSNSVVIGVLPIDMIATLSSRNVTFISVGIDPQKFTARFNITYNPKNPEIDKLLDGLNDDEFIALLRFVLYSKVEVTEVNVSDVINVAKGKRAIYYIGSPIFAKGLSKLFGLPVVTTYRDDTIPFSPIDNATFYMLKVVPRDTVINSEDEFINAVEKGIIKIFSVNAKTEQLSWEDVIKILSGATCLDYLREHDINLEGYSPDTYYHLLSKPWSGECIPFFAWLEHMYG